ncbi:MAG TPA: cation:proton antiporter [Thermoanaerobaculia bacterium]|nr:cation:proton antiporter [Thermoanaerobaculia bacterium]
MPEHKLLYDVAIILGAAFPILFLSRKFHLPEVVSFLLTGIVIGPHALGWIRSTEQVEPIAELGVALILFFVGLHMPIGRLRAMGRTTFVSGSLQMIFTTAVIALVLLPLGQTLREATFYGILLSLGSTAVVLPILATRDEMGAPYARRFLGVSLFQDMAVIPLILLVPAFASPEDVPPLGTILRQVGIAVVGVVLLIIVARTVVPALFNRIAGLGSREVFTAGAVVLIIGTIAAAEYVGISAALGAFAAGVVVGDTPYIHEISGVLRPFRDFLSSLFFASIGMLLDLEFVFGEPLLVLAAIVLVVVIKVLAAYPAFRAGGAIPRTSIRAAFAITPIGEFSFVLALAAKRLGILQVREEQFFLSVAVITLASTPLFVWLGKRAAERLHGSREEEEPSAVELSRHVIIVGYGLNGQNVARVLSQTAIPHVVVEEDPDRVAAARAGGSRVILADGGDPGALVAAGLRRAFTVVIAISDADGTRAIVRTCRGLNTEARIIVRTRYVAEVERLRELGADEVIPEEFETSIEIVMRVLRVYHVPGNIVASQLRLLRDEGYRLLRNPDAKALEASRLSAIMAAGTYDTFLVLPDSMADGACFGDLPLENGRVTAPVILRDGKVINPTPDEPVQAGDTLLLVGAHEDLMRAVARLEG